MTEPRNAQGASVLGALVADAAALGLHWLYDQDRVAELAGDAPEFCDTTAADFDGYPAYFAHAAKQPGDFSQYGEQVMVMLQSLAACGGDYNRTHYENHFRAVFGYGGAYVGYIDHPTKDTLDNLARADREALAAANALPFDGTDNDRRTMITKVTANMKQHSGAALRNAVEQAVRRTHDNDDTVAFAHALTDALTGVAGFHGADDEQLPAVAKLPALVARYAGDAMLLSHADSAVRVTNHNDLAAESGAVAARWIEAAIAHQNTGAALDAAERAGSETFTPLLQSARERVQDSSLDVVRDIGMSCNLAYGLPGAAHILMQSDNFTDAVRTNILAGGDSCGRATLIGAVAGAVYGIGGERGIPMRWLDRLNRKEEALTLLDALG